VFAEGEGGVQGDGPEGLLGIIPIPNTASVATFSRLVV